MSKTFELGDKDIAIIIRAGEEGDVELHMPDTEDKVDEDIIPGLIGGSHILLTMAGGMMGVLPVPEDDEGQEPPAQ
jgi:hypothetical protein